MFTFFEPELPPDAIVTHPRPKLNDPLKQLPWERRALKLPGSSRIGSKSSSSHNSKTQRPPPPPPPPPPPRSLDKRITSSHHICGNGPGRPVAEKVSSFNVLDLKGDNYFSCSTGRTRTEARYLLGTPDDAVVFFRELAQASSLDSLPSSS